jgi:N-acetylmuramoyl-L-alanine amidase
MMQGGTVMKSWLRVIWDSHFWAQYLLAAGLILMALAWVMQGEEPQYFLPERMEGKKIMIDPGHGGIDSGAMSALGDFEKEITLQISHKLATKLRNVGANVVMTREADVDYYTRGKGGKRNDLEKRIEMTEEHQAELFISIHCNAIRGKRWSGAQAFYYNQSEDGKTLAEIVQSYLKDFPTGNRRQAKAEDFYLLRKNIPASLIVEVGFLSNAEEAARLKDENYQDQLAEALFRGIVHYVVVKTGI